MDLAGRKRLPRRAFAAIAVGVVVLACAVVAVIRWAEPGHNPRAVFIGDSYTRGTGASAPDRRWSSLVAAARGWQEINLGNGGTGYSTTAGPNGCGRPKCPNYTEVVLAAVELKPDVVIVAGGQNDFTTYARSPERVVAAVDQTYAELRRALPKAEIIAVGPSTTGSLNGTVRGLDEAVQRAATVNRAHYVSLIDPQPTLSPELVAADQVHPNDLGHRAIADRVLAGLAR